MQHGRTFTVINVGIEVFKQTNNGYNTSFSYDLKLIRGALLILSKFYTVNLFYSNAW